MATIRFVAAVASVGGALVLAASAGASQPLTGTGSSSLTSSTTLSVRQAGQNLIIEQQNVRTDVGAFTGTVDEHLWLTVHPDGHVNTRAEATLHGTYPACGPDVVTQDIHLEGTVSPTGEVAANFATTGKAAVIVHGTVAGNAADPAVTFTIDYHC